MNEALKQTLTDLEVTYGSVRVRDAAMQVLGIALQPVPTEYVGLIDPQSLQRTATELDACVADLLAKGQAREAAYDEKAELLKQKTLLQTEIDLIEAEAIMQIQGEGKSAHVLLDDPAEENGVRIVYLTNDTARDAYRKNASAEKRKELSKVEAQLAALDVNLFRARDGWETAKEATDRVQAKAYLQSHTLKFLSGRV